MRDVDLKFDKIIYPRTYNFSRKSEATEIKLVGIDSETYETGEPFMFCTPDRDISPESLPGVFFTDFPNTNFVVYNISFDSGSLLYHLPAEKLNFLRVAGIVYHEGVTYEYIENKQLKMTAGKVKIVFWDIYQYYGTTLNEAAQKYLNAKKIDIETKKFSKSYVRKNRKQIIEYCKQDALLTEQLGYLVMETFKDWDIPVNSLISTAYISELHFTKTCKPYILGPDFIKLQDALKLAYESYSGGVFQCWKRGKGYFYMYDINSAYPEAIAELIDLRDATYVSEPRYMEHSTYSWLRCVVNIEKDLYHPLAVRQRGINFYPIGLFEKCMTKPEYEYLREMGVDIEILEGWHCYAKREDRKPFRDEIHRLYDLKEEMKQKGEKGMRYAGVKILMNSFYGKFMQLTPVLPKDLLEFIEHEVLTIDQILDDAERAKLIEYKAGRLWNPFYSSYITAQVRLKVLRICNQIPKHAVAVATDSIISTCPLEDYIKIGSGLGEWTKEVEGEGLVIGSGVYQVGKVKKFRGFTSKTDFLNYDGDQSQDKIIINAERPYSWKEVLHRGMPKDYINRFHFEDRSLDINFETRRAWERSWKNVEDMLTGGLMDSMPLVHMDLPESRTLRKREERKIQAFRKEEQKRFRRTIMDLGGVKPGGDYENLPRWCKRKNGGRIDTLVGEVAASGYQVSNAEELFRLLWVYS